MDDELCKNFKCLENWEKFWFIVRYIFVSKEFLVYFVFYMGSKVDWKFLVGEDEWDIWK